jgi:hypothetical protein
MHLISVVLAKFFQYSEQILLQFEEALNVLPKVPVGALLSALQTV